MGSLLSIQSGGRPYLRASVFMSGRKDQRIEMERGQG